MNSLIFLLDSTEPPVVTTVKKAPGTVAGRTNYPRRQPRQGWSAGIITESNGAVFGGAPNRQVGVWPPEVITGHPPVETTVRTTTVRTRPRPTTKSLNGPVVVLAPTILFGPRVLTVIPRTRPRPTQKQLGGPVVVLAETIQFGPRVETVAIHRAARPGQNRFPLPGWEQQQAVTTAAIPLLASVSPTSFVEIQGTGSGFVAELAQSFTLPFAMTVTKVTYEANKTGAPTDFIFADIQTDSGGEPSNVEAGVGDAFGCTSLPVTPKHATATSNIFNPTGVLPRAALVPGNYWIVWSRSATDAANAPEFGATAAVTAGQPALFLDDSSGLWTPFTGTFGFTLYGYTNVALPWRRLGPKPPLALAFPPDYATQQKPRVHDLPIAVARRLTQTQRGPKSRLFPPATLVQPSPPTPFRGKTVVTRPRPTTYRLAPPTAVTTPTPVLYPISTKIIAARPRRPFTRVFPPILAATTPPFPPIVTIQTIPAIDMRNSAERRMPFSKLSPPVVTTTAVFATAPITTRLLRTRPHPTRHSLGAPIFYPQTSAVSVTSVRARPRKTRSFLTSVVYAAVSTIRVTAVRTRPRKTTYSLSAVSYPTTSVVRVAQTRIRPRKTHSYLTATTYPQVTPITEAEAFVKTVVDDRRRRAPRSVLSPPVFYAATSQILVAITRVRPRRTNHSVTAVSYAQTGAVRTTTVRTRPRRTIHVLTFVSYPATSTIRVTAVRTRPRRTHAFLGYVVYPQVTPLESAEIAVKTVVDDRRRRQPRWVLSPPVFYASTSVIQTHVVRTRPRPTARTLAPPTAVTTPSPVLYPIATKLARTRPRHTFNVVAPPASLVVAEPPLVTTTAVTITRTRPRHTRYFLVPPVVEPSIRPPDRRLEVPASLTRVRPRRTTHRLTPLAFYAQTGTIKVTLVRSRPRPTRHVLTAVKYPQTSKVTVTLVRARPRSTRHLLTHVVYAQTTAIQTTTVTTRPRPTRTFLTHVSYPATSVIRTATVTSRPRKTHSFLSDVSYPQVTPVAEAEVAVKTVQDDRRRRQPTSLLSPPVFYPATSDIQIATVRARPRLTTRMLTAVSYAQVTAIQVTAVRTRPRATTKFLTVVTYPAATVISVTGVVTRPRRTHSFLTETTYPQVTPIEVTLAVKTVVDDRRRRASHARLQAPVFIRQTSTIKVKTVRARPRKTFSIVAPPASLVVAKAPLVTQITPHLARTRPRPTRHALTAVFYAATSRIKVTVVRTRPARTHHLTVAPVTYPATSRIHVTLARTRPRPTTHRLTAVRYAQTGTIAARIVRTRPRPTGHLLGAPTVLKPTVTTTRVATTRIRPRHTIVSLGSPTLAVIARTEPITTIRTRPRKTSYVLRQPTVVKPPVIFPPVATHLTILARNAYRPKTIHRIEPPTIIIVGVPGFTDGYTIGAYGGSAENIAKAGGSVENIAGAGASAEAVAESGSTIQAVPEAAAEATTKRSPLV